MRFYDIDGDREVALEQVAAALRPLMAQPATRQSEAEQVACWKAAAVAARQDALLTARDEIAALAAAVPLLIGNINSMTARAEAAEAKLAEIPWAALGVAMRYSPVADAVLWYQDNRPLEAQP